MDSVMVVLQVDTQLGTEKLALTPGGRPETPKEIGVWLPVARVAVIMSVAVPPSFTETDEEAADNASLDPPDWAEVVNVESEEYEV